MEDQKPSWEDAPDWAEYLGVAIFDCSYQGEWCWINSTNPDPELFSQLEQRPK